MWVDEEKYHETLNFELFEELLRQYQPSEDSILHDIQDIGADSCQMFKDLLAAKSTEDLKNYSLDTLVENTTKLFDCHHLKEVVCQMIKDETLLGDPSQICSAMNVRRLTAAQRRVL